MAQQYPEQAAALREIADWMSSLGPGRYGAGELSSSASDYAEWLRDYAVWLTTMRPADAARLRAISHALGQLTCERARYALPDIWAERMINSASYLCALADWLDGRAIGVVFDVAADALRALATIERRGGHEHV